ncbi:TetR family transcriptional regulator [Azorhizobium oxalatiphilum]|uniref:TetR family transcriptional regulator n=1 Tax=Azorhizobium oxalatiphilum TaxID=980631 RepID=A0A917FGJ0_9HYPH|nr:TetR/AcrR family transcriptional regulator [Azorhizobium oxalatiphilum]GGF77265.1 TetR family transcriptional regulator [Azorhizobium oxalatiphilum]
MASVRKAGVTVAKPRRAAASGGERDGEPRRRILAAAEQVFAARGFDAATLREITVAAGVNIAAVNYYFSSKEELVRQVLDRRMTPYTAARHAALEARLAEAGDTRLSVSELAEVMVRPIVELSRDDEAGGRSLIRLLLQVRARPSETTIRVFIDRVDPLVQRFVDAFQAAAPHLSRADIYWRYNFSIGAVMQVLTDADPLSLRLKRQSRDLCDTEDDEAIVRQLVAYITAAFAGPVAAVSGEPQEKPAPARRRTRRPPATASAD